MRLIALAPALALCIVAFACKGREQAPPDTAASVPVPPPANSAATSESTAGAVSTPAESAAARSNPTTPKATQKGTQPSTTKPTSPKTDSTQKTDSTHRKFKKPEVRPVYPPIDRRRTDTTTRRDTSDDR
ncbi:MAG TPA: hypothetical protein VF166_00905 [Gemmatimonadaceae bacterium]